MSFCLRPNVCKKCGKPLTMFESWTCLECEKAEQEPRTWNNHQVACLLADMFDDSCACNYNGIDEWLPNLCDFKDTCCPNPVGVACWEQFLKHSKAKARYCECGYKTYKTRREQNDHT